MSFPWWEPTIPEDYRATFPSKLEAMLVAGARRRAQILQSLGYSYEDALARVRTYLEWDYETSELPAAASKVDAAVGDVFGRKHGQKPSHKPQPPVKKR